MPSSPADLKGEKDFTAQVTLSLVTISLAMFRSPRPDGGRKANGDSLLVVGLDRAHFGK